MNYPWFCYLLECADGSIYTGITTDLVRRVREHNAGTASRYTRGRTPVRLSYWEELSNRGEATRRELHLKALPREEKLALIAGKNISRDLFVSQA
jgi:putative endonuclease